MKILETVGAGICWESILEEKDKDEATEDFRKMLSRLPPDVVDKMNAFATSIDENERAIDSGDMYVMLKDMGTFELKRFDSLRFKPELSGDNAMIMLSYPDPSRIIDGIQPLLENYYGSIENVLIGLTKGKEEMIVIIK